MCSRKEESKMYFGKNCIQTLAGFDNILIQFNLKFISREMIFFLSKLLIVKDSIYISHEQCISFFLIKLQSQNIPIAFFASCLRGNSFVTVF